MSKYFVYAENKEKQGMGWYCNGVMNAIARAQEIFEQGCALVYVSNDNVSPEYVIWKNGKLS